MSKQNKQKTDRHRQQDGGYRRGMAVGGQYEGKEGGAHGGGRRLDFRG